MTQNNFLKICNPRAVLSAHKPQPCCAQCGKHQNALPGKQKRIISSPIHSFILRDKFYQDGEFKDNEVVFDHHIENQAQILAALPLIQSQLKSGATVQINQLFSDKVCAIKFTYEQTLSLNAALLHWIEAKQPSYPWLCQKCSGYSCRYCGDDLNYTPSADSFNEKNQIVHTGLFPIQPHCQPDGCPKQPKSVDDDVEWEKKNGEYHFKIYS